MGSKHTAIIHQVLIDWTANARGTLWQNPQIRVPLGDGKKWTRAGMGDGTADIIGIENVAVPVWGIQYGEIEEYGVFTAIEVKTHGDWLKKRQQAHLTVVTEYAGRYYLALEMPGCTVEKPVYRLWRVDGADSLPRIQREWKKAWGSACHN